MPKAYGNAAAGSAARNGANGGPEQADLFHQLSEPAPAPADLDVHFELLGAVSRALREARTHGLDRDRVVTRMNRFLPELERPITLRQLNSWTATSKREGHPFPVRFLPAFCAAVECDRPLRVLAGALGLDVVDGREAKAKRLGESLIEAARLRREQRDLQKELGK